MHFLLAEQAYTTDSSTTAAAASGLVHVVHSDYS